MWRENDCLQQFDCMFANFGKPNTKKETSPFKQGNSFSISDNGIIKGMNKKQNLPLFPKNTSFQPSFGSDKPSYQNPPFENPSEYENLKSQINEIKAQLQVKDKKIMYLENMVNTIMPTLQLCLNQINQMKQLKQNPQASNIFQSSKPSPITQSLFLGNRENGENNVSLNSQTLKTLIKNGSVVIEDKEYKATITAPPFKVNKEQNPNPIYHIKISNHHGWIQFTNLIDVQNLIGKNISSWISIDQDNMKAHEQSLKNQPCVAVYYNFAGYADSDPYKKQRIVDELNSAKAKLPKINFDFQTGKLQVLSKGL